MKKFQKVPASRSVHGTDARRHEGSFQFKLNIAVDFHVWAGPQGAYKDEIYTGCSGAYDTGGAFAPDNSRLYVTCFTDGKVVGFNATDPNHPIVASFLTGGTSPESIVFSQVPFRPHRCLSIG
jgi:hypothetical protein